MSTILKYIILGVLGLLIIFISSLFQKVIIPIEQRDFSHFLNYNFTKVVGCIFFIIGLLIGYFSRLNPLYVGLSLFSIFPLTSLAESIINKGSHDLIPFEFIMYFFYSLPTIFAVYIARFTLGQVSNRKAKPDNKMEH
jgi:hypothetical protein